MDKNELKKAHPHYTAAAPTWAMIAALLEGTDAMRTGGALYLPPYKAESADAHRDRLSRSFLFGALRDTIDRHSGKPFSRPVQVEGLDGLALLSPLLTDADGEGQDLTSFARNVWQDAEAFGMTHILVDLPEADGEAPITRADELAQAKRPRFVHISALALYYWEFAKQADGSRQLVEIRWKEDSKIHRWTLDEWQTYSVSGEQVELLKSGPNTFGTIPLVSVYFNRAGLMRSRPPLKALAELNLKHWQDSSDQDNIERTARCGIIFAAGFNEDEAKTISIGPKSLCVASRPESKLSVVEFSGSSVAIGRDAIRHLETQMEQLGMKPEIGRSLDSTATGAVINESQATTDIGVWAGVIERSLESAFILAAYLSGDNLPESFKVTVYKDFSVAGRVQDMQSLIAMGQAQLLSADAVQREAIRRGVLAADHDIEADAAKISASGLGGIPAL